VRHSLAAKSLTGWPERRDGMATNQDSSEEKSKTDGKQKTLELYEKLLEIKEKNIIPLKEDVDKLRDRFYAFSLVVIVLGLMGYGSYNSLKLKFEEKIEQHVQEAVGYYNYLAEGYSYVYMNDQKRAIPYFKSAFKTRPDREAAFYPLMNGYVLDVDIGAAEELYKKAEANNLFIRSPWTSLCIGRFFLLKGLKDSKELKDSKYYKTAIGFFDDADRIFTEEHKESSFRLHPIFEKLIIEGLRENLDRQKLLVGEMRRMKLGININEWIQEQTGNVEMAKYYGAILNKDKQLHIKILRALSAAKQ
jgi:tetratricopeptide (TPR) repeat protein